MRNGWGKAKFQVGLLAVDIRALSASGLNLEEIFAKLSGDGRLDIGRSTFKRHVSELLKQPEPAPAVPRGAQRPAFSPGKANPFKSRDAKPDGKALFGDDGQDGAGNNVP